MKTQDSLNRTSGSERSLEIFIWIAAILVFIVFLLGSSASANNFQVNHKIIEPSNPASSAHSLTNEIAQNKKQGIYILRE